MDLCLRRGVISDVVITHPSPGYHAPPPYTESFAEPCGTRQVGDWAVAWKLFLQCGEPLGAAHITCKGRGEGWQNALRDIVR